jgi:hypothetical protein
MFMKLRHVENWVYSPCILNLDTRVKKVMASYKGRFKSGGRAALGTEFIGGRVFVRS